jgi:hypothetical protein
MRDFRRTLVHHLGLLALALLCAACGTRGDSPSPGREAGGTAQPRGALDGSEAVASPPDAWWGRMMEHCGNAYEGRLAVAPEGDEMLRGDELLVVHFRECGAEEMRLPFHIQRGPEDWDRSRTWIFTRTEEGIYLDHDHRRPDGTPDEVTHYGGHSMGEGSPMQQVFLYTDYEEYDPAGPHRGWRVEIEPHSRYTYGTFRGEGWRFRVDFELARPVEPPPPPWGHATGAEASAP